MTTPFSFSFAGDDIDEDEKLSLGKSSSTAERLPTTPQQQAPTSSSASAFPVQGKPLLPPLHHDLSHMLSTLPSKIAYSTLSIDLEGDRGTIQIPRRELWDVRVQLMAEEESSENVSESQPGLGEHDVKTGIYEGGFKSWESSVDLVKVLAAENVQQILDRDPCSLIELGCGTALPSLALFQWAMAARKKRAAGLGEMESSPLVLTLADYNPSVLYLVTLPNFVLAWALEKRAEIAILEEAFTVCEGELELTADVLSAFTEFLLSSQITLSFLSGAWSPEFVELLYSSSSLTASPAEATHNTKTLVIGAETIYSPFALESFTATLLSILERERRDRSSGYATAIIAAKRLYFGVGGSLDDFVDKMRALGAFVHTLREETDGVRRGVVKCLLS
ncbi:hypothetical protein B0H66DRAFT_30227 [Apodospora peruviana]|uniref:protein-histidine N-methyltransferase n=1 Tax=Apodospora peruviana TaxID=516989 RepID=A0AAE0MEK6_9PEZI|nr:hypothetical protein B0H66DRAFT_30227 [Apodospora peruviana]